MRSASASFATQRADQLSGGQRQRVGIARALMQEPDLVLADEPTSSLDPKTSVEIMELIARRAGERDIPVIVNIHNVELARRFADRIVGMSKGQIVFDGPPSSARGSAPAGQSMAARGGSNERRRPARRRRVAFPPNWPVRIGLLALALYVLYASTVLDITWARFLIGLEQGARFISRMFPPNVAPDKLQLLYSGMIESLQIAIIATAVGVLLSLPLGLAAARNLAPAPIAWAARAPDRRVPHLPSRSSSRSCSSRRSASARSPACSRSIVASLGFLSKLVAEAVEEMSMKQVEAVRATGSPFLSVVIMAVLPQVMPRFIGFSAYQLDSNLRNSALVGLVGGGGIGATLFTAFQRFDYDFVLTIVLAIIAIVMVGEILSGWMRRLFQ